MQEAWDQIEAIPGYARKKSGIPKIREFLGLLGDPDREFQVIHERKGFGLCFFDIDALRSGNPVRNVCFAASGGYPGAVSDRRGDGPGGGFCKGVSGGAGCL